MTKKQQIILMALFCIESLFHNAADQVRKIRSGVEKDINLPGYPDPRISVREQVETEDESYPFYPEEINRE